MARSIALDAAVVAASTLMASIPYVGGLGLYSDDWNFLSVLVSAPDQSYQGLLSVLAPYLLQRPPHLVAMVLLFKAFGMRPLGYHIVNALILTAGTTGFFLVLRRLRYTRAVALATAAVYGALPHYSTDRFWVASIQASIGMALLFAGTYALQRALEVRRTLPLSGLLGQVAIAGAVLSYEVFIPVAAVLVPAVVLASDKANSRHYSRRAWTLAMIAVVVVTAVVWFKLTNTSRLPEFPSLEDRITWFGSVIRNAGKLSFGEYGIALPAVALTALMRWPDAVCAAVSGFVGLLMSGYTYRLFTGESGTTEEGAGALRLLLVGPVAFVLGLTIFATNYAFLATPSGNANRIFIAAAVGVALTMVGGTAVLVRIVPPMRIRATVFAVVIGLLCFCGVAINNTLARFWVRAAGAQAEVINRIRLDAPLLPLGSTLLLDGVCPYIGPGIVFEAPWDLAGALQLAYGDSSLRADVVTPALEVRDDGVVTHIYAVPYTYPYSNLVVFDARRGGLTAIENAPALRQFLARADPDQGASCGTGRAGAGEPIF